MRVAGTDPGTSSLDILVLEDGVATDQVRFESAALADNPSAPVDWLRDRGPFDLVAGPSGYGVPLLRAAEATDRDLALMALTRGGEGGGVRGFSALLRCFRESALPVVFMPAVVHLPTVPSWRKINRIDLGTADKLSVAALAINHSPREDFVLVELGSAFTSCLAIRAGQVVDAQAGSAGPPGQRSGGYWDGELAHLLGPIRKNDLFAGGLSDGMPDVALLEGVVKAVAALSTTVELQTVVLSGRMTETNPALVQRLASLLRRFGPVRPLESFPNVWVKHAAQGAAILADGLVGGRHASLVERLQIREAAGTVLDGLRHPRADEIRKSFGVDE